MTIGAGLAVCAIWGAFAVCIREGVEDGWLIAVFAVIATFAVVG